MCCGLNSVGCVMLQGKTALITGSTSGIGLEIATKLASEGANVILNGFCDSSVIERVRSRLEQAYRVRVHYDAADMSKCAEIEAMMANAIQVYGSVDILVNNAGIQHVASVEEFPPGKWDAIIAVNLTAAFHTIRAVLPSMKARGWGRIVNMASAHALVASPDKSAYVAAKHGLAGLTKAVALEAAEQGVTVNAVCPGYVQTPLVAKQIPETAKARGITEQEVLRDVLLAAQPTKRFVTVEEVAALTVFLCSPEASSITGAILPIDGGWTAQ